MLLMSKYGIGTIHSTNEGYEIKTLTYMKKHDTMYVIKKQKGVIYK